MNPRTVVYDDRPDLHARAEVIFSAGWPEFIFHDPAADRHMDRVRAWFGALNLLLVTGAGPGDTAGGAGGRGDTEGGDRIVAGGWGVPVRWDGSPGDLPGGYDDALARAVTLREAGGRADTLVIAAAQVRDDLRGRGLAAEVLRRLAAAGERAGLTRVIAPVRPTLKARYPLTAMAEFARWTRPDGEPLDPWLRTHHRMGARVLGVAERSMTMSGSVADWERWSGLALPASGQYVVPGALAPLVVDLAADRGELTEPNVWLRHR